MIYTLCFEEIELKLDIKVNREQRISETMMILHDGGILPLTFDFEKKRIFSKRKDEYIDAALSYEEAEIFNGDILYIR